MMKPWACGPEPVPVDVGRGGKEDVSVVDNLVGLKRLEEGWEGY